jgi:hypothetical protein
MTELERKLLALGRELDVPEAPDLWPSVRARLAERPVQRRLPRRRALVLAFAALAVGAAFAVPPARTAILEWLGLRGVKIERGPEQPKAPVSADLGLGRRVTLAEARRLAAYRVLVPVLAGFEKPREVWFAPGLPGGQVAFVYWRKDPRRPRILLTQFRAEPGFQFIQKLAGPGTRIEPVTVNHEPGYWLEGQPHAFLFVDSQGQIRAETLRLAGNTLLWQHGELTLRLEGARTKAEALAIARSLG